MSTRWSAGIVGLLLVSVAGAARAQPSSLWIEPVAYFQPRVHFADELQVIEEALAEIFARPSYGGYRVAAPAELHAMWTAVRQGRLPGSTGVCEEPPPPAALTEQLRPGSVEADPEIRCGGATCTLSIVLRQTQPGFPQHQGKELARYEAKLPSAEAPAAWAKRLREAGLTPPSPVQPLMEGGGLGIGSRSPPPGQVRLDDLVQSGPWSPALTDRMVRPAAPALIACERTHPGDFDWWSQSFVIELSAAGSVRRCEPKLPQRLSPDAFACQCAALGTVDFGAGRPGRRAQFNLLVPSEPEHDPQMIRNVYFDPSGASDPTAVLSRERALSGRTLARCLDPVRASLGSFDVPATLSIGGDGRIVAHQLEWPAALPASVRACLDAELAKSHVNCPSSGSSQVQGKLRLVIERSRR